jgi:KDO2-lipid IV(A) lauroyltransferase
MYHVVYGLLYLVSLLPLRLLYVLSDAVYGLLFYVIKYRRNVVMSNLLIAFPEKSEAERKKIAKNFYHNLVDTFIETIKMISVSDKYLEKRFTANWEVVNALKATGKPLQLHLGHNFNWEWGNAVGSKKISFPFLAVYMPIGNKIFDRLFRRLRSRSGTTLLRATRMQEDFLPYRNTQYLLGLVADQNPGVPTSAWWFSFFGRPTPFVKGPAKNAITNNTHVVFAFIRKRKRGYYEAQFESVQENISELTEQELTKKFVAYLENVIRANPEMWLWSHRRWKWEWKEEYGKVIA